MEDILQKLKDYHQSERAKESLNHPKQRYKLLEIEKCIEDMRCACFLQVEKNKRAKLFAKGYRVRSKENFNQSLPKNRLNE